MGCFSVHCAITGLPIYDEEAVLIGVSPSRFKESGHQPWQPCGLPIYGEADSYGRLEEFDTEKDYILIHRKAWESVGEVFMPKQYAHEYKISLLENSDKIHAKFQQERGWRDGLILKSKFSDIDLFWRSAHDFCDYRNSAGNYFLFHKLFFNADQCVASADPENEFESLYRRSELANIVVTKLFDRSFTADDELELNRLSLLWSRYPRITGKYFMPVLRSAHCEQFASKDTLAERKKFYQFCGKLATELSKELNK